MKNDEFVDLYQLTCFVDVALGCKTTLSKYKVKKTDKNYIYQGWTEEDEKNGYNGGVWAGRREPLDCILKVDSNLRASPSYVSRYVFFLDGQLEQAKELLRIEMTSVMEKMKSELDKIYNFWINRNGTKP